jgi:hypothetical protein
MTINQSQSHGLTPGPPASEYGVGMKLLPAGNYAGPSRENFRTQALGTGRKAPFQAPA